MENFNFDTHFVQSNDVVIRPENFGAMVFDKRNWSAAKGDCCKSAAKGDRFIFQLAFDEKMGIFHRHLMEK